jgi:phospholipase/carboxylesterase
MSEHDSLGWSYETIEPIVPAKAAIIWLHGLGADGHDFVPMVPELSLPAALSIRFIFPHAPIRPVTLMGGQSMRAWYDLYKITVDSPEDETGLNLAREKVIELIDAQHATGISYNNIFLAGFSQGGALTLYTALNVPHKLGGAIAISTYLPLLRSMKRDKIDKAHLNNFPIFMAHGTYDPVLPFYFGEGSKKMLKELGCNVDWRTYAIGHTVCPPEIHDISRWIQTRVK